jgi:amino acid adenylation domain-containing protein
LAFTVLISIIPNHGGEYMYLSNKEQYKLLYEFNNTKAEYPKDKVMQELFEEQVEKTPDKLAIVFEDKKLTYRELNERSNQLAKILRERGVRPDQAVGLMVEISIEMIIGMIGILKAGGAFLPIDPDYPKDRIEYMIENSNLEIILTQSNVKERIPFKGKTINLENQSLFNPGCSNIDKINQSKNLVYIYYTSGSTGKPKGVQIQHYNIMNQIFGLKQIYTFDSSFNHILLAPITFDPAVQQIFLPLTTGGKLFLVSKQVKNDMEELLDFIVLNQIDIVNTVPSLMSALLYHLNDHRDLHFKYIILAGEPFSKSLYLRLIKSLSADKIINIYGPTEATINTTLYECKPEEVNSTIPIGKPLMNYKVLILDEHKNLLPIGETGEIYISGEGLARGYLNNPELTAERFIENPYMPGEKMYRTGDLAKWLSDGNIEFFGRIDHQVKIHGMRIELGEIEAALGQHPAVREAVVLVKEDINNNKRLVAYYVTLNQKTAPTISELRSFLKKKLPDYMVPSAFVLLDKLPLTSTGKINHRALPAPDASRPELEVNYVAPNDHLELQLTKIWEKVLNVQPIGVRDNFFELGGHSLLAVELFAQIHKNFGKKLPLATLFEAPTIEQLAIVLRNKVWSPKWSSLVAIQPSGSKPPFFCVHGAGGNVLNYHRLAHYLGSDQPFYGLQSQGLVGLPSHTKIEEMASSYLKEIQTIQPKGPYYLGGYCMGGTIAYDMAQQLYAQGQQVALLALIETYDWSKITANSFIDKVIVALQQIEFLLRNFLLLKSKRTAFLIEKLKGAGKAIMMKTTKDVNNFNFSAINIQATKDYIPQVYPGKVTHFRPLKVFARWDGPQFGWEELAAGGVDLIEVPVYPVGMLDEPFVKDLADLLKACVDKAQIDNLDINNY